MTLFISFLMQKIKQISKILLNFSAIFLLLSASAFAQEAEGVTEATTTSGVSRYSAADMLTNIAKQVPELARFITALAYVAGMLFIMKAVIALKHAGEGRTMMSHEHSMKRPMVYMFIGVMLLYMPSAVQMGMSTFWSEPNPYGYLEKQDQWAQFYNTCFMIVQLIGIIAFVRGLLMLSQLAGQGGHPGVLSKAVMHIIGGIFCINIYQFVQVVMVTLGLESPI